METVKMMEKATSEEIGLDYQIVEKVIEDNFVQQITLEELVDKLNHIASSKHTMVMVEVLGVMKTPVLTYHHFQALISAKEIEDDIEETFMLLDYGEEVGTFQFSICDVDDVLWDEWNGYFLIKLIENIELMISYLEL